MSADKPAEPAFVLVPFVPSNDWRPFGLTMEAALNRGDDPAMLMDENSPLRDELRRLLASPQPEARSQWVSVEDRMPQSGVIVLVAFKWDHHLNQRLLINRAIWVAAKTEESNSQSDIGEYDEETDAYYDPEGWYEKIDHWDDLGAVGMSGATVTHWQPLPEGPKP